VTCDRCGNPAAETYGGLCGRCSDEIADGMWRALEQGDDGPPGESSAT
jgi:NMD protein affecting ribosome stability and mRNA decay